MGGNSPYAPEPTMAPKPIVWLGLEFAVGATGAVGATTGDLGEMGATPVTRNGVGDYTIALRQGWASLFDGKAQAIGALVTTDGVYAKIIANSVTSTSAPAVRFQFEQPGTGAAAEVASGAQVIVTLGLRRT